eukprot:SAG31_NODE_756_length_12303_cov_8.918142_8_plen_53_part_00
MLLELVQEGLGALGANETPRSCSKVASAAGRCDPTGELRLVPKMNLTSFSPT